MQQESIWEDNLVEFKVESDLQDILKTIVAFANSVKPDHIAVLKIGVDNSGFVKGVTNPDSIQKRVRSECDKIYPPVLWKSFIREDNGKTYIEVQVESNGNAPHFGGQAWFRKGSETIKASEEVFQTMIALRSDINKELYKWINQNVSVIGDWSNVPENRSLKIGSRNSIRIFEHRWSQVAVSTTLIEVNQFWVTFLIQESGNRVSEPIKKLSLSFDNENKRLKVIVDY